MATELIIYTDESDKEGEAISEANQTWANQPSLRDTWSEDGPLAIG